MREADIQDRVRLVLGADRAGVWWRNNVGLAKTERGKTIPFGLFKGSADLVGLFRGHFVAVEVKTPDGEQSTDQVRWQKVVEDHGGIYAVVRSEEDARALLSELHRRFPA